MTPPPADPAMSEIQLQASILDLCKRLRLMVFHIRDSRRNIGIGFPDLVIIGPHGQMYRELKSAHGQTTPEQEQWLAMLEIGGADVGLWRPYDWHTGVIAAALKQLTHPRHREASR